MNKQQAITAYAITITIAILMAASYSAGRRAGVSHTEERVNRVLNHQANEKTLGRTFDAMCQEFPETAE